MLALLRLATAIAGQSAQRTARRYARVSALFMVAMVFLMIGLTGFAVAGFILLARVMDPAVAALLIGSLCCLIAAILLLVARMQARPAQQPFLGSPEEQRALLDTVGAAGIWTPLAIAALAGFILTSRKR